MTRILITGGTGTIGRRVVPLLAGRADTVRVASRRPATHPDPGIEWMPVDTVRGTGLDQAVTDIDTVLHLAGGANGDDTGTRNTVHAAHEAGIDHVVLISVVGADRMPIGYFRRKASSERIVEESGIPHTIIRVAQLHQFVHPIARTLSRLRLAPRGLRFEPVDVDRVAERLAELVTSPAAGKVGDLAGPEVLSAHDLVMQYRAQQGKRGGLIALGIPGAVGRAYTAGDNLAQDPDRGVVTWRDYLDVSTT
ncbi:NAD(P)H-binding protein [Microbacterium aoyamense]|uniref:NAD(P)H-binding protein n=1 Tax=Microbacterium aoyamense TaxID=344166 RepID=A0ABP5ASU7_9MICO|nr:NAD(P)H-binding protein [Microbacterium aoyamense]